MYWLIGSSGWIHGNHLDLHQNHYDIIYLYAHSTQMLYVFLIFVLLFCPYTIKTLAVATRFFLYCLWGCVSFSYGSISDPFLC